MFEEKTPRNSGYSGSDDHCILSLINPTSDLIELVWKSWPEAVDVADKNPVAVRAMLSAIYHYLKVQRR